MVEEHQRMLYDEDSANHFTKNSDFVCNCIGDCTCGKQKLTTNFRLYQTNQEMRGYEK